MINDEVGDAVKISYQSIILAKIYLKNNQLNEAVIYAKKAFEASEKAFFDPSLLALLYFPGDQKYAIYIPLFMPVLLPVFMSIYSIYKHFHARAKVQHEKLE